jgi:hypothetical protein
MYAALHKESRAQFIDQITVNREYVPAVTLTGAKKIFIAYCLSWDGGL